MIRRLAYTVSLRSRRQKLRLLIERMQPDEGTTVLDVGVTDSGYGSDGAFPTENFFEATYPWPHRITAVGLGGLERFRAAFPHVQCVSADGRELPFEDRAFELGVSNAVVEHFADRASQERFVHELCRVSQRVFVSTPNRWFPIEVHTLLPVIHWLPRAATRRVLRRLGRPEAGALRLLGPRDFRNLFPYPVELVNTGLSLIAIGGHDD